jgi:hypothetical protein
MHGATSSQSGYCPNLNVAPPSWRLNAGWKPALHLKLGQHPNRVIGSSGDWVIGDFRSQQINSYSHQALPITDVGECVTLGVWPSALCVIPSSDFGGVLSRDARLKF